MDHLRQELGGARRGLASLAAILALTSSPALGAGGGGSTGSLAASLARLRGEVEALSDSIEILKADQRTRLRSLAAQKAELEIQIKREQFRLRELAKGSAEHHARVEQLNARRQALRPLVPELAAVLERTVAGSLPFRLEERRKEPLEVKRRFESKLLDVDAAVAQLWALLEDELRLGHENGIYSQTLVIDGKEHLVEVARVGMVMLFFCTRDGRYGLLRRQANGAHEPVLLPDKLDRRAVAGLFDAFKKQIRTGFFVMPNALGAAATGGSQ